MDKKKRVLVAPLNWGLGHAARCIPIVNELLNQNVEVILAANGRSYDLLKIEFPQLELLTLKGYQVRYPKGSMMGLKILCQLPKIGFRIVMEHIKLQQIINRYCIDGVISDNRFGLFTKKVPCVFITHQIMIQLPKKLQQINRIVHWINRAFIMKYNYLWVPDFPGGDNLSGILGHPYVNNESLLPENTSFIGPLSRFKQSKNIELENDILVLLSGPEPQRTKFEYQILEQIMQIDQKILVVRGIPESHSKEDIAVNIKVVSYLNSKELNRAILRSKLIICRPGYSTIMDLAVLGKKAIFVPTPGQTEQEYLADRFMKKGLIFSMNQREFDINFALQQARNFTGFRNNMPGNELLKGKILQFLKN